MKPPRIVLASPAATVLALFLITLTVGMSCGTHFLLWHLGWADIQRVLALLLVLLAAAWGVERLDLCWPQARRVRPFAWR